ncbi:MAG: hypothetical protein IT378_23670 [Sandaracinaceae bacterium]|nr:hypothetical protein [Sandaracinaceae bacterium]
MPLDRFLRYDVSELRACGETWVQTLREAQPAIALASDPDAWTELVLDWLAGLASERARVDARPARPALSAEVYAERPIASVRACLRAGPFAMAHLTHPPFDATPYGYAYWAGALERERLETLLIASCEWGAGGRAAARYGRILLSASDMASVDARAKAIFFATDGEEERRRVVHGLEKLRLASWDARPWLWVDCAWRTDPAEHGPGAGVLEG